MSKNDTLFALTVGGIIGLIYKFRPSWIERANDVISRVYPSVGHPGGSGRGRSW